MPILPDQVQTDLGSTLAQENAYIQQFAGDITGARATGNLISAYRLAAPSLPAATYNALAAAGVDPYSPDFGAIIKSYMPSPRSNLISYIQGSVASKPKTVTSTGRDQIVAAVNPDGSLRFASAGETGVAIPSAMTAALSPEEGKSAAERALGGLGGGSSNPFGSAIESVGQAVEGGVKTAFRWTSGALQYPLEVGQNAFEHEMGMLGNQTSGQRGGADMSLADMLWRGTHFGQAVAHGGGQGFLLRPGGSGAQAEQVESNLSQIQRGVRGYYTDPKTGQPILATPGRAAAAGAGDLASDIGLKPVARALRPQLLTTDKDTLVYNVVSGLVDAGLILRFDPAKPITELYQDVRAARGGYTLTEGDRAVLHLLAGHQQTNEEFDLANNILNGQRQHAGMIGALTKFVHGPSYLEHMDGADGQRVLAGLSQITDRGELIDRTRGAWKAMPQLYTDVAHAQTPDAVRAVLDRAVLAGSIDELPVAGRLSGIGGARYAIGQPLRDTRIASMFPGRVLNPNDPERAIDFVDNYAKNALLSTETRHRLLGETIDAMTANPVRQPNMLHSLYGNIMDSVYQRLAGTAWWEGAPARSMVRGIIDDAHTNPTGVRMFVEDAIGHTLPGAHLSPTQYDDIAQMVSGSAGAARAAGVSQAEYVLDNLRTYEANLGHGYTSESWARDYTRYNPESVNETRQTAVDMLQPGGIPAIAANGEIHEMTGPQLYGQLQHGEQFFPDPRTLRRATSSMRNIMFGHNPFMRENGDPAMWIDMLDAVTKAWKTVTIMRPALTVRTVADLQAKLASSGHDSMFGEGVLSVIASMIGSRSDDMERLAASGQMDLFGSRMADLRGEMGRGLAATAGTDARGDVRHDLAFAKDLVRIASDDRRAFSNGWAWQLNQFNNDPVARAVAEEMTKNAANVAAGGAAAGFSPRVVTDPAFWHRWQAGDLSEYRRELALAGGWRTQLLTDDGGRAYIDEIQRQLDTLTAGRDDLRDAVTSGVWNGAPIGTGKQANSDLLDHLRGLSDQDIGPTHVQGPQPVSARISAGNRVGDARRSSVDWLWAHTVTAPIEGAKDQAVGQLYNEGLEKILPLVDPAEREKILDAMHTGNTQQYATAATASGMIGAHEADFLAKGYAAQKLKAMTLDLHERSQFGDIIRLVSPFADHWRQLLVKWAQHGVDNFPLVAQRLRQAHDWTENNGWFYTDQYGTLNFHVPLSGLALGAVTGDKMADLTAPATGLSIGTEGMPGIGGTLAIPADMLMREIHHVGGPDLEKRLLPYGAPDTSGGILEAFAPRWAQKLITAIRAPEGQRDYAEQLAQTTAYLQSRYPDKYTHTPDGHAQLYDDAKRITREQYVVRGISQALLPAAPKIDQKVRAGDTSVEAWRVAKDYSDILDRTYAKGGQTADAVTEFLTKYGENDALLLVPQTDSPIYGLASTAAQADWRAKNRGLTRAYPDTWALFAPNANDNKNFSYTEYQRQLGDHERTLMSWKDRVALAEYRIGSAIYDNARSKLGANPARNQQIWLEEVRNRIAAEYPGYNALGDYSKPGTKKVTGDELVNRVATAANDPRLANNQVAEAVRLYMSKRAQVLESLNSEGKPAALLSGSSLGQKSAINIRAWLRNVGANLVKEVPSFAPAWDSVFAHEVQEAGT